MIPPTNSLVKYENPILVTKKEDSEKDFIKNAGRPKTASTGTQNSFDKLSKDSADEILDLILPPKEWESDGQKWLQHVSSTPATRIDVLNLQEQLDTKLQQRQAREIGICPIRRELYDQCFDELIRQIAISCAERGLLLLRVRDELRMTLAAYQTLYESSIAFGIRKALQAEHNKVDTETMVEKLKNEKEDLTQQIAEWKIKCTQIEKSTEERRQLQEQKHDEEIQKLKRTNENFKAQLEAIIFQRNK